MVALVLNVKPLTGYFVYYFCYHLISNMGILKQIAEYLYLKKRDPNDERTQWMKYMHGINRLSILLFLFAIIVIIVKLIRR